MRRCGSRCQRVGVIRLFFQQCRKNALRMILFFLKRRIELEVYYAPVLVCLYPLQSCRLIECDGEAIFQQLLVVLSSSAFFFFPRPFCLFLLPSTPLRVLERTIRIPPGRHESILFAYRYLPPQEITSYQPSSSPLSTALAAPLLSLYFFCGHIYIKCLRKRETPRTKTKTIKSI